MSRGPSCRYCLALGLLTSALLHGATLYWWSRTAADTQSAAPLVAIDLDLAMFTDAPATSAAPTEPNPPQPGPADPVNAAPPVPPPPPLVHPVKPDPAPAPDPAPGIKEPRRTTAPPAPRARPRPAPTPKPEVRSLPRPKPQPQHKPTTPARPPTSAPQRVDRPPPELPHQLQARDTTPIAAPTTSQTNTQTGRPGPTGGPTPGAPSNAASPAAKATSERAYLAELQRAIGRWQRFPEAARQRRKTGVATVAFVVAASGGISQVRIVQSAGDPDLDRAALEALNRLGRFKPIPALLGRASWSIRVPIRFNLR